MQIIEVETLEIETRLEIIVKMKIGMLGTGISKNQIVVILVIVLDINVVRGVVPCTHKSSNLIVPTAYSSFPAPQLSTLPCNVNNTTIDF